MQVFSAMWKHSHAGSCDAAWFPIWLTQAVEDQTGLFNSFKKSLPQAVTRSIYRPVMPRRPRMLQR